MFKLNVDEMGLCDDLVEAAAYTAMRRILNERPAEEAEVDNEVRLRMIGALENLSPYGRLSQVRKKTHQTYRLAGSKESYSTIIGATQCSFASTADRPGIERAMVNTKQ